MKKLVTGLLLVFMVMFCFSATAFAAEEGLTIKGDGVATPTTFSKIQLTAMKDNIKKVVYTSTNNFPTDKSIAAEGVSLAYLLEKAGVKADAKLVRVVASDGYEKTFTYEELLKDARYSFEGGKQTAVAPIIAYTSGEDDFLKLMMGQRIKGEQTTPWFVKKVATIEVSTAAPQQWQAVSFVKETKGNQVLVTPNHQTLDSVKIYYTTDGSEPTINSTLYNVSASYYQPALNQPIVVTKDTVIKAVAIGAGKTNSKVASTQVSFGNSAFTDLAGFDWAADSINSLSAKGIINGAGNHQFQPAGSLKRAEFAKMMVLALGEKPAESGSSFSDVAADAWYYGYVEKAAALGLIKGYEDGTFRPNQILSKEEMVSVVVNSLDKAAEIKNLDSTLLTPFKQENKISAWAKNAIAYAESIGLLERGHMVIESGNFLYFNGQGAANRAEAAVLISNFAKIK